MNATNKFLVILAATATLCLLAITSTAQLVPPGGGGPTGALAAWFFPDTNWLSQAGLAPRAFTNLSNVPGGNGYTLLVDSTNAAFLNYPMVDNDGQTNLTLDRGTVSFWFRPNWTSASQGGSGPGEASRLIEVGAYTTNANYGWWSLYLDSGGTNLYFAAQTNTGYSAAYLSAPIAWTNGVWHYIVLTYSATITALYLDGLIATNGPGVTILPGAYAQSGGFFIGSDAYGTSQAHGQFDDLNTYNFEQAASTIIGTYNVFAIVYYGADFLFFTKSAPATNTISPFLNFIGGLGWLQPLGSSGACATNGQVYLTNVTAVVSNDQTVTVAFSIAGGTNGVPYDVFATAPLIGPKLTNSQWVWLGQGHTCNRYAVTNQPNAYAYYVLGIARDSDFDGLTDAYELLVSKTDPNKADSDSDGVPEGWLVMHGLPPSGSANQDPDFDALINKQEYLFGTKPEVSEGFRIWVASPGGITGVL